MADEVLTIEEVAAYLKVSTKTVRRLVQRGELPGFQVGNQWRFKRQELDDWTRKTTQSKQDESEGLK